MIKKPGSHGKETIKQSTKSKSPDMERKPVPTPAKKVTAYCVKCKEKQFVKGGAPKMINNRSYHSGGTCSKCGTKVSVVLPKAK
jgi:hypothetical protein